MRWSQLKHRAESMFADGVRGRVQLYTTHYRCGVSFIHGFERRSWITVDGRPIVNMHRHRHVDDIDPDYATRGGLRSACSPGGTCPGRRSTS